ncbi:hypothetical protein LQ567_01875 [Niabella pedocola]|uniref:Outer membrane protein beta-barrel domain-containing protein n=1 Tax=Niabella pedocola TaxID=1752077 RepID=A0ABS8PK62_9BACT|nr:hypothetical protein [Niabella pedocola]MCD2421492.1 hypothetical protein [Niabella pedocola]
MEDHQDDFLKHIKGVLRDHEEEYRPGAWEQFSRQHLQATPAKPARIIPLWKRAAVAAAVLAGVFLIANYFIGNHPNLPGDVAKEGPHPGKSGTGPENSASPSRPGLPVTSDPSPGNNGPARQKEPGTITPFYPAGQPEQIAQNDLVKGTPAIPDNPPSAAVTSSGQDPVKQTPPVNTPSAQRPVQPTRSAPYEATNRPNNTFPMMAQLPAPEREHDRSRKWTPSLYVSPMFGETDVNVGYGISLGYAVNDRIKVSAGIAHNKLTASRDFDVTAPPSNASLSNSGNNALFAARSLVGADAAPSQPQLETVRAAVSGFDIPVDISYSISKNLYASAGVSGLVVVKDNTQYTYVTSTNTRISVENNEGILQEDKNMRMMEYATSNAAPEASQKERTPFIGFYNLSMGYKQKITPKNNVAIEPFVKVPMKTVSDQKLNYTGMGIRLKFDF